MLASQSRGLSKGLRPPHASFLEWGNILSLRPPQYNKKRNSWKRKPVGMTVGVNADQLTHWRSKALENKEVDWRVE